MRTALVVLCSLLVTGSPAALANDVDRGPLEGLHYRPIGPAAGGRVSRLAGVPGEPLTAYGATAAGGVWKTSNGGVDWSPVFDDQPVSSIGSIAVASSDPNVVWVGSGEANIRGNVAEGNGIYRSTDAGKSWSRVWSTEGQIGTIIVHPRDPDVAFAAVLGSPFGAGPERGVFRTVDGGGHWEKVLFVDPETGASDVCFDPHNPRLLFAGTWQARRTPWGMTSGGPGGGLYTSRDGGDSWQRLEAKGLPEGTWGKVGVRVAPSDSRRVYALIEAEEGGLFRSDDGGESWRRVSSSRGLRQRAWYYTTLTVDPQNADVVWFPQVGMLRTVDGGNEVRAVEAGGWDYHDVWIDPADPLRILVASDAGISLSRDGGSSWSRPPLPISQFYHLTVDSQVPYRLLGSLQDYGTLAGPSNSLHRGGIRISDWSSVGGGEAGHVVVRPDDPDVVWAGEYLGFVSRFDGRTGRAPHVGAYLENGSGHGAKDLRYRFQWTAPIVISPHDPDVVYHAANVLFRSADGGQNWTAISPDLTRNDPDKQRWAGGPITGDNTGVEFYDTIFAVAESPLEPGLLWVGSDDGLVHVTRNGGAGWKDVTPRDLPTWATVSCIEASRWQAGTAYVVADAHRLDDERPYLWKTSDFGDSWSRLGADLDSEVYLHVVREDAVVEGLLYVGTERGVRFSRDGGKSWPSLRLDMPTVAVVDLAVTADDLVVATLGRSAFILDDLTPVRQLSAEVTSLPVHLFPPLPAVAWFYGPSPAGPDTGAGKNSAEGATLTYWLEKDAPALITLEILDGEQVIRTLRSVVEPQRTPPEHPDWDPGEKPEPALATSRGFHRVTWDLHHQGPTWVPGSRIDSGDPGNGPLVLPGPYTARLSVDGVVSSRSLEVRADPRDQVAIEDRAAQLQFSLAVARAMTAVARRVEDIEDLRRQLEVAAARPDFVADEALDSLARSALERLHAIEEKLHNPHAEVDYDVLAGRYGGAQLYSRLGWLFDGARQHLGPPTRGMLEMQRELAEVLAEQEAALRELVEGDLAAIDDRAAARGLPLLHLPGGASE